MINIFDFFINGVWLFENQKIFQPLALMSPEDKCEFQCDPSSFKWGPLLGGYINGILINVLKEDHVSFEHNLENQVIKNKFRGDDSKMVRSKQHNFVNCYSEKYEKGILQKSRFQEYYNLSELDIKSAKGVDVKHLYNPKLMKKELLRLRCSITKQAAQGATYLLSKLAYRLVDNGHIDTLGLKKVKALSNDRKVRVVLMPLCKSFLDIFITHYVNFFNDVKMGF